MKPKILIVDDLNANIVALQSVISKLDITIESTTSGAQALGMILENDYALVLMDVHMPEMNGFEVLDIMRKKEQSKRIPVIFVTAVHKDEASMISGYDTGAVDYMYKPLNPEIVLSKVQVFVDLYRQKQQIKILNDELMLVNKGLQDFTHIASHDLQEPLRTIGYYSSYLKHLLGEKAPKEQVEATETITATAIKMSKFIADLLDYSKCDWHFEPEDIELEDCLGDSLDHLSAQIKALKAQIV
jgi:CheY-like chemotaxis protein